MLQYFFLRHRTGSCSVNINEWRVLQVPLALRFKQDLEQVYPRGGFLDFYKQSKGLSTMTFPTLSCVLYILEAVFLFTRGKMKPTLFSGNTWTTSERVWPVRRARNPVSCH
jgi:hypothetical protein